MEAVFRSFCSFGADKGTAAPLMDGSKLVKLCRDLKLLDKSLTSTDVDIIYSKVKPKTERKINFKQFEEALKLMADKKFPGTDDAFDKLKAKILEGGGPVAYVATKAAKTGAVDRLTEATTKASSSGVASGQKTANSNTNNKAKAALGGNGKSHSSQATGKSVQSTNGKLDGKITGGKPKSIGDAQKQTQTPDPGGKESNAASKTLEKEAANGKESSLEKADAQGNAEPGEKGFQQNDDEELPASQIQESQDRKQDS